ncbi:hypothetical protein [Panacibacter ginsenosidivorans]|uniref:hypothetical protein n=1 Tax=Panacibacter ginsenosidivorans TaxID=1813871 RepID=UPI0013158499|nr:hypothetical protein [Panacibacter ginsenosidivorans]
MTAFSIHEILNLSVLFAAFAAVYRFKLFKTAAAPFLLLLWLASFNELLSLFLILQGKPNALNGNIYVLLEFILLCYQFKCWGSLKTNFFYLIISAGFMIWISDNIFLHHPDNNNSIFRIAYSLGVALLAIDQINRIVILERGRHDAQPICIICIALSLYFGFKTFAEVFNLFDLGLDKIFYYYLWFTLSVVNGVCNILFMTGILCFPRKQPFILRYY